MKTLGDRIRELRIAQQKTQVQLGDLAGVSKQAISKIESGDTKKPASSTLDPIAESLGVTTQELRGVSPYRQSSLARSDPNWRDIKGFAQAAGLGNGAEAEEYAIAHSLKFRTQSLSRKRLQADKLCVFYGKGDSMLPRIHPGDAILFDTTDTRPQDGMIYILMWKNDYYAKRAEILDDVVYFRADNPHGDHGWKKPKKMAGRDPIEIIGRVRWIGSWEGYDAPCAVSSFDPGSEVTPHDDIGEY